MKSFFKTDSRVTNLIVLNGFYITDKNNMQTISISLNSIDKVKDFVNVISTYDGDFDLASERYVVDAKSIMGIFSLDLGKPLRLDIHNDSVVDSVKEKLKNYIV